MPANLAAIAPRLAKLVLLLSSDRPGEVAAAASAIDRALRSANANWHDLVAQLTESHVVCRDPPLPRHSAPDPGAMLAGLLKSLWLSEWEHDFVRSMARQRCRGRHLSNKQLTVLRRIWLERAA